MVIILTRKLSINENVVFVIDVMNVVTVLHGSKKIYKFERLKLLIDEIKSINDNILFFAVTPKYLQKKIDNKDEYLKFIKSDSPNIIEFHPRSEINNDNYFIEIAKKSDGFIITNDILRDYPDKAIRKKLLPFKFFRIDGKLNIILPWVINCLQEKKE